MCENLHILFRNEPLKLQKERILRAQNVLKFSYFLRCLRCFGAVAANLPVSTQNIFVSEILSGHHYVFDILILAPLIVLVVTFAT